MMNVLINVHILIVLGGGSPPPPPPQVPCRREIPQTLLYKVNYHFLKVYVTLLYKISGLEIS